MMTVLEPQALEIAVARLPHWHVENGELVRIASFGDFVAAIAFVNRIATLAEQVGHHPDIDIRYNQVRLALVTHDAGGITGSDTLMASRIDQTLLP
jgi:4a-hydroxytetrahydrobiopterin dehydratase